MHLGKTVANGSALSVDMIGEDDQALICITTKIDCCSLNSSYRLGEWYYPGRNSKVGVMGLKNETFYRTRGHQKVLLHRRNNGKARTGMFCCEVPDSDDNCGINQILCVSLGENLWHYSVDTCMHCMETVSPCRIPTS